jgi:hypothetical protein
MPVAVSQFDKEEDAKAVLLILRKYIQTKERIIA